MKSMFVNRLSTFGLAALSLLTGIASAQSPVARIAADITSSEYVQLRGSQHPLANPQFDAGRMPTSTQLTGVTLSFKRSAAQEADLQALLAAQQNPSSPEYHQWLTPDQFAARFGMADTDLEKVQTWLQQQGFKIDTVNRSRNAIRFSGSVGQIESAFQTQMHYYSVGGVRHFAPSTALSVPAALGGVVSTVRNLSDFRPRANLVTAHAGFTSGQTGNVFFAPGDIATAYDVNALYSGGTNGAGQTIAVMGQSFVEISDVQAFLNAAGLTRTSPTLVLVPGTGNDASPSSGDESESDLDLEWSSAMAPGANVAFVYTGSNTNFGVFDSAQYAIDEKIGNILSISYSSCETELSSTDLSSLESMFSQAAAQGQTVVAASGDQGSTACSGDTSLSTAQQEAVAVNYPASSAYVTGVGGTEISAADSVSSNSTYWVTPTSGTDQLTSLKEYIPEVAWNDDSAQYGLSASGGGASALVARPSWQAGVPGIASGSMRLVPDVALYSSPNYPGFLYCTSDSSQWQTGQIASCNSGFRDATTGDLNVAGGTSFATPIFAGMVAILNQKLNYTTGQGLINPTLYTLAANGTTYASAFHDVTSGNNDCTAGSSYCSSNTGFSAGTGYDEVTGLGSVDLGNLAAAWPTNGGSSAALIETNTTVTAANTAPTVNTSDTFTITVASESGTTVPTGTVTLQIDGGSGFGGTTVTGQTLNNGSVTYATSFSTSGTHQVIAQYSGDTTHAASTGVGEVVITVPSSGKGTIALAATNLTVAQGSSGSSTITVTPASGYTGTVYLTFDTSNDTALQNLCYEFTNTLSNGDGSVSITGTSPATTQLTLDTNASDCATAAAVGATGKHAFKTLHAASSLKASNEKPEGGKSLPAGIAFGGLLLAGLLGRSSRKLRGLACMIALAAAGLAMTACGSSSTLNSTVANPPKGTYTITVTGTDSSTASITSTTTFTFTIQ